jgi:hypothetical protein
MKGKLIIGFENLSEPAFLLKIQAIAAALEGNANFPPPWPPQLVDPAKLVAQVSDYKDLYLAAQDGDRNNIKLRVTARVDLTDELKKIAPYLEIVADGDPGKLASSGYDQRHDIVKSAVVDPLGMLADLKVTRGVLPGTLHVHAKAEPKAISYHVQVALGDPSVESNWTAAGEFEHCNRIELTGLTTGKTYYVRICAFNKHGHGAWTTSAGVVVL